MVTALKTLISFFNNNRLSVDLLGSGQLTLNDMDSVIEALRSTPDHMLISDVVDRYVLESCKTKTQKSFVIQTQFYFPRSIILFLLQSEWYLSKSGCSGWIERALQIHRWSFWIDTKHQDFQHRSQTPTCLYFPRALWRTGSDRCGRLQGRTWSLAKLLGSPSSTLWISRTGYKFPCQCQHHTSTGNELMNLNRGPTNVRKTII